MRRSQFSLFVDVEQMSLPWHSLVQQKQVDKKSKQVNEKNMWISIIQNKTKNKKSSSSPGKRKSSVDSAGAERSKLDGARMTRD